MKIKRLFSAALAALILGSAAVPTRVSALEMNIAATDFALSAGDTDAKNGLLYTELDDGTYEVGWDYSGAKPSGELEIPSEHNGKPVTRIACAGFAGCDKLTDVIVPDTVVSAGENAFLGTPFLEKQKGDVKYAGKVAVYCSEKATSVRIKDGTLGLADKLFHLSPDLKTAQLPDGLVNLGFMTFDSCSKLTEVNIPKGVTAIESGAFYGCASLQSIKIPGSVESVGAYAFAESGLKSVTLPKKVAFVGKGAFENCRSLAKDGVKTNNSGHITVGGRAFYGTPFLEKQSDVAYLGTVAVGAKSSVTSVELKDGTTAIADMAFAGCSKLKSIAIPSDVQTVGEDAFFNCTSLKDIELPEGVASIGEDAFRFCTKLSSVIIPKTVEVIEEGAFYGDKAIETVKFGGSAAEWAALEMGRDNDDLLRAEPEISGDPAKPSAIKSLAVDEATGDTVSLSWKKSSAADSYRIEISSDGEWTTVGTTSETSFKVRGLEPKTDYELRVIPMSKNVSGASSSVAVTTKTKLAAPEQVTGLVGLPTSKTVALSWDADPYADCYQVDIYKGGEWKRLKKTKDNSVTACTAKDLSPSTEYKFRVFALKGSQHSQSKKITVTTASLPANDPQPVKGLKSSATAKTITLKWNKASFADYYEIDVYKNGKWKLVKKVSGTSCTIKELTPNKSYKFRVYTFVGSNHSAAAKITAKTAVAKAPETVKKLKAETTASSVTLSWKKVAAADSYRVDIYKNGKWVKKGTPEKNSFKISGLSPNTEYKFRVFSYSGTKHGTSAKITVKTAKSSTVPEKVTGLKVKSTAASSVTLTWKKASNAEKYKVDVYKNGKWSNAAKTAKNTYTVKNLTPGTTYKFRIISLKGVKQSAAVKISAATKKSADTPSTVTGLKASPTVNSIKLSWNKVSDADKYEIDMYKGGKWTYLAKISGNSYTVKELKPDTTYKFRVFSFKGDKYSTSAKLTASTSSAASSSKKPATVNELKGSSTEDSVTLSWKKTSTADSYEIDMYKDGKWVYVAKITGTTYTVTELSPDTVYKFKVFSYKGSDYSPSAAISVTTKVGSDKPAAVTGLTVAADAASITLSWEESKTADSYEIDVYLDGKWTYIDKTEQTTFTISDLEPDTTYQIRVFSFKGDDYSASTRVTASTAPEARAALAEESVDITVTVKPPVNTSRVKIKGIDVSGWQGAIDFRRVKLEGYDYVIIKAGYSTSTVETWETNYQNARESGMDVGAYWYSYALNSDDAALEAQAFIKATEGKRFDYPLYYDIEEADQFEQGKTICSQLVEAFCNTLETAGFCAGVYCSTYWYTNYVDDDIRQKRPSWIAQYYDRCYYTGSFGMWQYGYENIAGIESSECDVNFGYYDYSRYIREHKLNGN